MAVCSTLYQVYLADMERFSFKEWIKNPQRKVVSRRGNEVSDIEYIKERVQYCIGATENRCKYFFTENGEYLEDNTTSLDLFFADDIVDIAQPKTTNGLVWRKCKAGYKFPSEAIVIP